MGVFLCGSERGVLISINIWQNLQDRGREIWIQYYIRQKGCVVYLWSKLDNPIASVGSTDGNLEFEDFTPSKIQYHLNL